MTGALGAWGYPAVSCLVIQLPGMSILYPLGLVPLPLFCIRLFFRLAYPWEEEQ